MVKRPTYGYRRITAVLNRDLCSQGLPPVKAFPFIHEAYPAAWKKFHHWSGVKRSQISPMASMN